jgi:hypothetical protein
MILRNNHNKMNKKRANYIYNDSPVPSPNRLRSLSPSRLKPLNNISFLPEAGSTNSSTHKKPLTLNFKSAMNEARSKRNKKKLGVTKTMTSDAETPTEEMGDASIMDKKRGKSTLKKEEPEVTSNTDDYIYELSQGNNNILVRKSTKN